MTKKQLDAYLPNKRLINRNKEKIKIEQCKDMPIINSKVKGSSHDFPYLEQYYSVEIYEPEIMEKKSMNVNKLNNEIKKAEKQMEEVEHFINGIPIAGDREIFIYRYIDGVKIILIADKVGYSKGRISQIIKKYIKD